MTTDERTLNFPQRGEMTFRWEARAVEIELTKVPGRMPVLRVGRDLVNLAALDDLISVLREARYALAVLGNLHREGLLPALVPEREEAPSEEGAGVVLPG